MPSLMDGFYHKGFALYQMQDYGGAAHAFKEGLKICPADRVIQQGFWDAVTLLSQTRLPAPNSPPPPRPMSDLAALLLSEGADG